MPGSIADARDPLAPAPVSSSPASSGQGTAPARGALRVLVIDDHVSVLQAMRNLLELDGHLVSVGDSGPAGIALVELALTEGTPFEVVFTDFGMPGMDGGEVAQRVKQARPQTWVVMLSGGGPALEARQDWQAWVDRVLGKPTRLAQLRAVLADARGSPG